MLNLKTYVRKKRKQTMENDVGKQNLWEPETPSKSTGLSQQHMEVEKEEEVGVGSPPMKSIPVTINQVSENGSCDQVGSPMKQFCHATTQGGGTNPLPQGKFALIYCLKL